MYKSTRPFLAGLFLILALSGRLYASEPKIACTILPVSNMVNEIAGGDEPITILPPGANPHTFELTPQLIKDLDKAVVIFRIGQGFDDWVSAILDNLPNAKLIELNRKIELIDNDPHYWLSVENAKLIAQQIAETLTQMMPQEKLKYDRNLEQYLGKLEALDQRIHRQFDHVTGKEMITFHDGWRYFARDYGLSVVATIESKEGNGPTPKSLTQIHRTVGQHHINVLFIEPGVSKPLADSVAHDLHLQIVELDPFGFKKENKTYTNLMSNNADLIAEALKTHG